MILIMIIIMLTIAVIIKVIKIVTRTMKKSTMIKAIIVRITIIMVITTSKILKIIMIIKLIMIIMTMVMQIMMIIIITITILELTRMMIIITKIIILIMIIMIMVVTKRAIMPIRISTIVIYMWKTFLEVKFCCMENFVKSSVREKLDHLTLHFGKNHADSDKSPEIIAKSVVDVHSFEKESNDLIISNLVKCKDKFSKKAAEDNVSLKELCRKNSVHLINQINTVKTPHLNRLKLHLNRSGSNILKK